MTRAITARARVARSRPMRPGRRPRAALVAVAAGAALAAPATVAHAETAAAPSAGVSTSGAAARPTAADRLAGRVAAGWLNRQFVDGERLQTTFGGVPYDDAGLTLDAVIAFAAAKTNSVRAGRALAWLAEPAVLGGYLGTGSESYAGAHGKLAYTLSVSGRNPRSFGGRDVVTELVALQKPSGRLSDASMYGDYSNTFGQSFGVLALQRAGAGAPARRAAAYLEGQACRDGGLPDAFEQSRCVSSTDATAIGMQALVAAGRWGAANRAATWLSGQVRSGALKNTNTAGLVAAALDTRPAIGANAADRARTLIRSAQQGCGSRFAARGAIAYDGDGYDVDTAPRATTQAILGLAGANLATLTADGAMRHAPALAC